jgi:hypothetical protein
MPLDPSLEKELRWLRVYAFASSAILVGLAVTAFRRNGTPTRFDEIEVHRINIVEPDGKLRMVISNKAQSSGPMDHGTPYGYAGGTRPGIIFFNDEETENGGLLYEGAKTDRKVRANAQLSFDQYGQDQVVYVQYAEENGFRSMGLYVDDRPEVPGLADAYRRLYAMPPGPAKDSLRAWLDGPHGGLPSEAHRVYVGRDHLRSAILRLADPQGRPRLRLLVDSLGVARIEFLDDMGRVVRSL